jgi:hypothetical protein
VPRRTHIFTTTTHHPPVVPSPKTTLLFLAISLSLISDMSQLSSSSSFQALFGAALQDYEIRTGTSLVNHPLAKQLEECDSLDSITAILQEKAKGFRGFRRDKGKLMKSVKCSVNVLYILSISTVLGEGVGVVRPKQSSAFLVLDRYSPAIPACESHIRWHCHPTRCMSLFFHSQLHISLTSKFGRR